MFPKRSYTRSFTITILLPMIISMFLRNVLAQNNSHHPLPSLLLSTVITESNCPKPMIWYTDSDITSDMYCIEKCCLPCPYPNNFYPVGALESIHKTFAVFGIISFFLMFTLAVWFLLLPNQRNNNTTRLILLPLVLSVCWFESAEIFTLQQHKSQCINPVLRSNIHENYRCAAQAFITLGGAYAIASWAALLMLHLHLISVWRSDFIIRKIFYINIYIWSTSLLAAIIPMAMNKVESNDICFIDSNSAPIYYYFLFFIYISFLAHLMTFAYMTKVTIKANWMVSSGPMVNKRISTVEAQRAFSHVKAIFRIQWRAMLGAILMLVVYMVNWIFYVIINTVDLNSPLLFQWTQCLLDGGSQNSCSPSVVPSLGWTITLLFFNRFLGIMIFIIVAAKKSILVEVWDLLNGRLAKVTSLISIERGERFGRTSGGSLVRDGNDTRTSNLGETSPNSESTRGSNTLPMIQKSTLKPVPSPSGLEKELRPKSRIIVTRSPQLIPARASFGITPLKSSTKRVSFTNEANEGSKRTSRVSSDNTGGVKRTSRVSFDNTGGKRTSRVSSDNTGDGKQTSSRSDNTGDGKQTPSRSNNTGEGTSVAAPNRVVVKVSRSYQRKKRISHELAMKMTRNSITEVSEFEEILEVERFSEGEGFSEGERFSEGEVISEESDFGGAK